MNICMICKYPPIEGGVSMHNYWIARSLAQRGHKVHVVTNANEVEDLFRIQLSEEDKSPNGDLAMEFPDSSGYVKVYSTEPPDRSNLYYVPLNNPTVTRLATIATDVIRAEQCEVIFSYYLEPYGLAAHLASSWTGVPYIFKHAGSDLYRLATLKELQTAYLEVLYRANRIISGGRSREHLIGLGVLKERICSNIFFGLPMEYFCPDGPSLDIGAYVARQNNEEDPSIKATNAIYSDPALPKLGVYGKVGEYKGSYDLLKAMAALRDDGFVFNLFAMVGGWRLSHYRKVVEELGLTNQVFILPFQPHWRVPDFIRAMNAVVFLERDFPIEAHGPTIPAEVISCGKCLILSEEVARKHHHRASIRNFNNLIVVPDPKRIDDLARCIRFGLENAERANQIGLNAHTTLNHSERHFHRWIDKIESLLLDVTQENVALRINVNDGVGARKIKADAINAIKTMFPLTYTLMGLKLQGRLEERVAFPDYATGSVTESPILGLEELDNVLQPCLVEEENGDFTSFIQDVYRYEYRMNKSRLNKNAPSRQNQILLNTASDDFGRLIPIICDSVEIEEFRYDVKNALSSPEGANSGEVKTPRMLEKPIKVMFHGSADPVQINALTEYLLRLINAQKSLTVADILSAFNDRFHPEGKENETRLKSGLYSTLESMYWMGVITLVTPQSSVDSVKSRIKSAKHAIESD